MDMEEEIKETTTGVRWTGPFNITWPEQRPKEDNEKLLVKGVVNGLRSWENYSEVLNLHFIHCKPLCYLQAFSKIF